MLIIDIGDLMDRGRETDDREYWLVTSLWIATQYSKQFRKLSEELHPLSSVFSPRPPVSCPPSTVSCQQPEISCRSGSFDLRLPSPVSRLFHDSASSSLRSRSCRSLPSSVPGPQSHVLRLKRPHQRNKRDCYSCDCQV